MSDRLQKVVVAGAGAFGTALALVAERAGRDVVLWGRGRGQMDAMRDCHENVVHLPGAPIPEAITFSAEPEVFRQADLVLLAVPSQSTREALSLLVPYLPADAAVIACAKGIEQGTGKLQTGVIAECLPGHVLAALSGPGFAEEIARGLPTAVTIAAANLTQAHQFCAALSSDTFRPYASDDLVGVELAGAVKNVLAIACGVVAGRGLGESARAALIARGIAEMTRLGTAIGARPETFMGLAGIGDIVLTATSGQSRNTAFGIALGQGRLIADLMKKGAPLVEGSFTASVAADLATRHNIETPIIAAVAALVAGRLTIDDAIEALISRPLKAESE